MSQSTIEQLSQLISQYKHNNRAIDSVMDIQFNTTTKGRMGYGNYKIQQLEEENKKIETAVASILTTQYSQNPHSQQMQDISKLLIDNQAYDFVTQLANIKLAHQDMTNMPELVTSLAISPSTINLSSLISSYPSVMPIVSQVKDTTTSADVLTHLGYLTTRDKNHEQVNVFSIDHLAERISSLNDIYAIKQFTDHHLENISPKMREHLKGQFDALKAKMDDIPSM